MNVDEDFICEHGMPKPWSTCTDCMFLPDGERPVPPRTVEERRSPQSTGSASKGRLPQTESDGWPQLVGTKDLSYPVYDVAAHTDGPGNDWLAGEHGFPKELRSGGWIYLRHDGRLGARGRVRGIGFRTSRPQHTGNTSENWGPGPTIEVDPNTWEHVDIQLGELAESQRQGYRYLITQTDGTIVHLPANEAIPDDVTPDDPVPAKLYTLLGPDGHQRHSWVPGAIGGNTIREPIWGNLNCPAALNAGPDYAKHRVFFASVEDATAAGFRPCGTCRPNEYSEWKATQS